MANGIPYFPLDCRLDEKFEYIEAEFGLQGFAIVVKLLQRIYSGGGYYCEWNERVALLFARRDCCAGVNVVREVVSAAIRERIFDGEMLKKHGVLTSRGIQKRYYEAARRRKQVFDKPEYVLITHDDFSEIADNSGENADNPSRNVNENQQSKVKKSKEKHSKAEQSNAGSAVAAAKADNISAAEAEQKGTPAAEVKQKGTPAAEAEQKAAAAAEVKTDAASPAATAAAQDTKAERKGQKSSAKLVITREKLVSDYGEAKVKEYERRFDDWCCKYPKVNIDRYSAISKWMTDDRVAKKSEFARSIEESNDIMRRIMAKYPMG